MCYKARSRNEKLEGVSVILTLEITGVPSKSSNRTFPWPVPTFVPPPAIRTRSCDSIEFEVTLFECGEEDFLVREYLYSWRLKQLERAIVQMVDVLKGYQLLRFVLPNMMKQKMLILSSTQAVWFELVKHATMKNFTYLTVDIMLVF